MATSKKLKLRTILRPYEAADYLSKKLSEKFYEYDLYAAALNQQIKLSLLVRGHVNYLKCKLVKPISEFEIFDTNFERPNDLEIGSDPIFDLAMIGLEVDYLKRLYQDQKQDYLDECKAEQIEYSFCFIKDNSIALIYEDYDSNPKLEGSWAWYESSQAAYSSQQIEGYSSIYDAHVDINRKLRDEMFKKHKRIEFCAHDLIESPEPITDNQLVVTIDRLDKFAEFLLDEPEKPAIQLSSKERNTLLVLIATMCKQADFDWTERGVAGAIEAATEEMGTRVSDDTIRNILKQIPDALESRQK